MTEAQSVSVSTCSLRTMSQAERHMNNVTCQGSLILLNQVLAITSVSKRNVHNLTVIKTYLSTETFSSLPPLRHAKTSMSANLGSSDKSGIESVVQEPSPGLHATTGDVNMKHRCIVISLIRHAQV